jgi:hypothetical protein
MSSDGEGLEDKRALRAALARAEVAREEAARLGTGFAVGRRGATSSPDWLDGGLDAAAEGERGGEAGAEADRDKLKRQPAYSAMRRSDGRPRRRVQRKPRKSLYEW